MKIRDLIETRRPCFSFEFFPPRSEAAMNELYRAVDALRDLVPTFVSVTYGAGGSTRSRTVDLVKSIKNFLRIEPLAHLTCVGATREELHSIVEDLTDAGVRNVLALRGDPPKGQTDFVPVEGGYRYASELTADIAAHFDVCIGGACYPEVHPEAASAEADLAALVAKVEAGTDFLISQLFFDNDRYFAFVDRARAAGITVPILPGVMPITNYEQVQRFTQMCGATIPDRLRRELDARAGEPEAVAELGTAYAALQCRDLLTRGAPGIHFYTLNKSPATRAIVSALRAMEAVLT